MVFRDRQELSPSADANQSSKTRDRYLDNCFLLCMNRDDQLDVPEIHRLENHLIRELCQKNSVKQIPLPQRAQTSDNDQFDDEEEFLNPRQAKDRDYMYRRKERERESPFGRTRSRYPRGDGLENYYNPEQYSRTARLNPRDDYNIMQNSDEELSVYEVREAIRHFRELF